MTRRWIPIREAAQIVGVAEVSLRRAIERNAMPSPDGGIESAFDGILAKKLGRVWRVCLSPRWLPSTGDDDAACYLPRNGSARRGEE